MKLSLIIALLPMALAGLVPRDGCFRDNCARAVDGTRAGKVPSFTSRENDCQDFLTATIAGTVVTTTITVAVADPITVTSNIPAVTTTVTSPIPTLTISVTAIIPTVTTTFTRTIPVATTTTTMTIDKLARRDLAARQMLTIYPTQIPEYAADACDNDPMKYWTACSCWPFIPNTVTLEVATVTYTHTVHEGTITTVYEDGGTTTSVVYEGLGMTTTDTVYEGETTTDTVYQDTITTRTVFVSEVDDVIGTGTGSLVLSEPTEVGWNATSSWFPGGHI